VLWLKIPEKTVKTSYERDAAPDPYNYHYSSAPTVDPSKVVHRFQINMPKIPPRAQEEKPFLVSHEYSGQEERGFVCNLCNAAFKADDELSSHVESSH
jgi:hypothetical protein